MTGDAKRAVCRSYPFSSTLLVAWLTLPYAASAGEAGAYLRDGAYLGFSVGAGGVELSTDEWTTDRRTAVAVAARAGQTITPTFLLGANVGYWPVYPIEPPSALFPMVRFSGETAFYPYGASAGRASGLFARAGLGLSYGLRRDDDVGPALFAGLGHEFRLGDGDVHIGFGFDWHFVSYGDGESVNYWEATLQITRY